MLGQCTTHRATLAPMISRSACSKRNRRNGSDRRRPLRPPKTIIGNKVQLASIYSICSRQPKKLDPGATMTERNRSFSSALGLVVVLIVAAGGRRDAGSLTSPRPTKQLS